MDWPRQCNMCIGYLAFKWEQLAWAFQSSCGLGVGLEG